MRTKTRRTLMIIATAIVATALLVGGGVAVAAQASSDDELAQMADRIRSKDAFVTTVAKELGTTAAKLEAAIVAAANARIDAAEQAGSLSAADADLLRETVADASASPPNCTSSTRVSTTRRSIGRSVSFPTRSPGSSGYSVTGAASGCG